MITLITGVPGAGKTLNTLKLVMDEVGQSGRPIYYFNIDDLTLPWEELSADQARDWNQYPSGSVFLFDECHKIWPNNRRPGTTEPDTVRELDEHRHKGYDFYLVTQQRTKLDFGVRNYCGRHIHFERQLGYESCRRFEWQQEADPKDYHHRQNAIVTRVKFPKDYYSVYKSAEIHTVKKRIPFKVWLVGSLFLVLGVFGARFLYGFNSDPVPLEESWNGPNYSGISEPISIGEKSIELSPDEYLEQWTPRLRNAPHTAPIYDQVAEVKTFPRPQCMRGESRNSCRCYSQQATPIDIDLATCNNIVDHGWFNPYLDESNDLEQGGGGEHLPPPQPDKMFPQPGQMVILDSQVKPHPYTGSVN